MIDSSHPHIDPESLQQGHLAPGDEQEDFSPVSGVRAYLVGLLLASVWSAVWFYKARCTLVSAPFFPLALWVLALAQIGVHLVFFLHITTGKDSINNILALAFGILIVMLLVFGSLWIMSNLNRNMLPMDEVMKMQR
jgi:cytochrome o ubiquinol oxidase operon protein cyoD